MRKRPRLPNTPDQTAIDFGASEPEAPPQEGGQVAESPAVYSTAPGWVDMAGKTRNWLLLDPHGTQMAAITTRRDARKIADLLNSVLGDERDRSK